MILSDALILPICDAISQLQKQQVMTLQIRSHLEYLQILYSCADFVVEFHERSIALMSGFNTI